ncbi:MAG: ABC transporter substrate-binding protein [Candidatus Protistobacter heckmanni]|nr:ABC transporter substrate-binding protein [Candidatus Protistobacter heckmanni]
MLNKMLKAGVLAIAAVCSSAAFAQTKVRFLTNWFAEEEHGGFYQALADGIYKKAGLDVEIKMGGPQINGLQLLLAGQADMIMGYDLQVLKAVEDGFPVVTVAAAFQKDPQAIFAHPDIKKFEELKGKPIAIAATSNVTFWPWLRGKFGFTDDQIRPYTFSVQPFIADKNLSQQGYITSETLMIQKGGVNPTIFLMADYGYPPYATTVITTRAYLEKNPEVVKKFVAASAQGWKNYFTDPALANVLIKKDDPQQTDEQIAFGIAKLKEYKLVTDGDAAKSGIMTMTDARWKGTYDFMVAAKLLKPTTDYKKAYTLDAVKDLKVLP